MNKDGSKTWHYIKKIYRQARKYKLVLVVMVICMMMFSAANGGRIWLIKCITDDLRQGVSLSNLGYYIAIFVGISLAIFALRYATEYFSRYLVQKIIMDIRIGLFAHIINLPMSFFNDRKYGDNISRMTNDLNLFIASSSFLFDDAILQPLMALAAIAFMFTINLTLGIIMICLTPLYIFPIVKIAQRGRKSRKKSLIKLGDMTQSMMEMHTGIRTIKVSNMEDIEVEEFKKDHNEFFRKAMNVVRSIALTASLTELGVALGTALLFYIAGYLIFTKTMTMGDVAAFCFLIAQFTNSIKSFAKSFVDLQDFSVAGERIFEILEKHEKIDDDNATAKLPVIQKGIEYRNLSFAYDTKPVLRNVNITVKPGEVVAIVGRSGVGKSTMLDLLCKFYSPTQGSIFVDGIDIKDVSRRSLLKHIACVTQENFLFNTTVAENIRYGKLDASMEEVVEAAKVANIHDFITTMPNGYDTVAGEKGAKLSGGQRQRIAIARAIIKNPAILILDEAMSALDTESENQVQEALNNLLSQKKQDRITFIVAHRFSTIKYATKIILLDNGEVAESGTHDELMKLGKLYSSLYQTQILQ